MVRRMDRHGEVLIWCRKMFRICEAKNGTKIYEVLQAVASGHQRVWQDVRADCSRGWQCPGKRGTKDWKIEGQKRRITRKECHRLLSKFERGFMA